MNSLATGTHSVTIGTTRLVYHVAGAGPVMIAHSGGPGVDSAYLRTALLEEHFTMVYPEPPGTGDSGPLPESATYVDTYADFVHALVDHLGLDRTYLLGHSHGGLVALAFTLRWPERTAGIVLYSAPPQTTDDFWQAAGDAALAYPQRHPGVAETADVVAAWQTDSTGLTQTEKTDLFRRVLPVYFADFWSRRSEFGPLQAEVRSWTVTFPSRSVDYRSRLADLRTPTVIVTGRHDFICGPVWAQILSEGITGSRLTILDNSGHFANLEEPQAFRDCVLSLLALTTFSH